MGVKPAARQSSTSGQHERAAVAADPLLGGELLDGDLRPRREPVAGRQAQQHRVLADQAARAARLELVHDRGVNLAGREQLACLRRLGVDDLHGPLRMRGREAAGRERDDRGHRGRKRRHPQARVAVARQCLERVPGLRQLAERDVGVTHEQHAGVRERRAARAAPHERHARLALEQRDLLGDRGRRVVERERSRAERSARGDLGEHPQARQVHTWTCTDARMRAGCGARTGSLPVRVVREASRGAIRGVKRSSPQRSRGALTARPGSCHGRRATPERSG